jgi:hypothetical protein
MSARQEMRALVREAIGTGLTLERRRDSRIVDPQTRRYVTTSGTPSCPFAAATARRDIRRYLGLSP